MEIITYSNVRIHESSGCGRNPNMCYRYFFAESSLFPGLVFQCVYTQYKLSEQEFYFGQLELLNRGDISIVDSINEVLSGIKEESEGKIFTNETVNIK